MGNGLKSLKIDNFQSIKSLDLPIGKYTVLVGKSNSGKSAILRALQVLLRNNTFSPAFVRSGAKTTTVSTLFEDGTEVEIKKGGESTYTLRKDDAEEVFTKSSRDVPSMVASVLAVPLIAEQDINYTNQFDGPFLVSGKSSVASSVMGSVTNVVTTQALAQEANRLRLNALQKLRLREEDITSTEAELEAFTGLPDLEVALGTLIEAQEAYMGVQSLLEGLQRLVTAGEEAQARADAPIKVSVPDIHDDLSAVEEIVYQAINLGRLMTKLEGTQEVEIPTPVSEEFIQAEDCWNDLYPKVRDLQDLIERVESGKAMYLEAVSKAEYTEGKLDTARIALQEVPVCDACGQPITI